MLIIILHIRSGTNQIDASRYSIVDLSVKNIENNSVSEFEQPNKQPNTQATGQVTAYIITKLNLLFNYINKEVEKFSKSELEDLNEIGLTGDEKCGIVNILKRLDLYVPNEIMKYLNDDQILEYKIKYWAVKEIYISPHKALLNEIDKDKFLFRFLKARKYKDISDLEDFTAYFIKCLQNQLEEEMR